MLHQTGKGSQGVCCQVNCLLQVYFEMGLHTNRVHFHAKDDGSKLLGLSLPIDLLSAPVTEAGPSTIQDLLKHLENRCSCTLLGFDEDVPNYLMGQHIINLSSVLDFTAS